MNSPFQALSRQPNLSDQVVEQMQELITSRQLKPGERLPSERELADRFGVSRTVIREAVRSLVAKGLLEVKPGSGMVISVPRASSMAEHLNLLLQLSSDKDPYDHVFEVRHVLEVEIAGLAARRANPENIQDAESFLQIMEANPKDLEKTAEADVEFHASLANATQNPLFSILIDSVAEIMLEVRLLGLSMPGAIKSVLEQHSNILDRVKAGDVEGARLAMADHLIAGKELMKQGMLLQAESE